MRLAKKMRYCASAALLFGFSVGAQADFVGFDVPGAVLTGGSIVSGSETDAVGFSIANAGTYRVSVVDFEFLAPFELLGFAVSDGADLMGVDFVDGGFTFMADAGDAFFHYSAQAGAAGIGAFGVQIAPIPIPAAAVLFTSALIALGAMGRRRGRSQGNLATA